MESGVRSKAQSLKERQSNFRRKKMENMTEEEVKQYKESERERVKLVMRKRREKMKNDKQAMDKFREKEKLRIRNYRKMKKAAESPSPTVLSPSKVYSTRQSFGKAIQRVKKVLPVSPSKRVAIKKFSLGRNQVNPTPVRRIVYQRLVILCRITYT